MRLFIAVSFPKEILDWITRIQTVLRGYAVHGNFTRRENLHLTLHFLGEIPNSELDTLRRAMQNTECSRFTLTLGGLGVFQRGGDLWWLGIQKNDALNELYRRLGHELAAAGFAVENRPYKPHLTLGREIVLRDEPEIEQLNAQFSQRQCEVERIHLMRSERLRGILTYTSIYKKDLPDASL